MDDTADAMPAANFHGRKVQNPLHEEPAISVNSEKHCELNFVHK